ncbi:helix-turn-helix domain-containing protein [Patescibacteria group bacterium]|nr:helix-turn-helix domain-containing protein [Patescibacteria group bacterium]MBU1473100.1 helix-turn-helix domain-containing protein [Patescibacteria group bacterium]MBU2459636.1 helix-turn-helix domain-containing protein [Patescibacteria group bacterium]MBU2544461.1 helix-turn-helix domain-containing protein [Patescibacteria group bacterium]
MKIAPYYQKLLEAGMQAASSLEPITFAGMSDSGIDYIFTLSVPLFTSELGGEIKPVFLDISGLTTAEMISAEISAILSDEFGQNIDSDYSSISKAVKLFTQKTKLVFVMHLGHDGFQESSLFVFINHLRNLLGWRFSYCIFTYARVLFQDNVAVVDKVLKRNIVPVLPLLPPDAQVVLGNYEERYGEKTSKNAKNTIISNSGGNPGLLKALYLQAIHDPNWKEPNILEEQLYFRLNNIALDLSKEAKAYIQKQNIKVNPLLEYLLFRYGYIQKISKHNSAFTPLLVDFLQKYQKKAPQLPIMKHNAINEELLYFTKTQRKVMDYLREHTGELISKDTLAQVLWGENWADRYSDWAIDQLISTLRDKLHVVKHEGQIITKRGEGIIYLSKKI